MKFKNKCKRVWHLHILPFGITGLASVSAGAILLLAASSFLFAPATWLCFKSNFSFSAALPDCKPNEVFWQIFLTVTGMSILVLNNCYKAWKKITGTDSASVDYVFRKRLWLTELKAFKENINLTRDDRITLYFYVSKTDSFFKVGRESQNHEFKKSGRPSYRNGIIHQAFHEQEKFQFIDSDYKADKVAYIKEVMEKSQLTKSEVKNLTMHSRALYGRIITKLNNDPVGVLLIETLKPNFEHIECWYYEDTADERSSQKSHNPLTKNRLRNIFERECKRLSHFIANFEVPSTLFEFEEANINA